jgi:hypothetical protein
MTRNLKRNIRSDDEDSNHSEKVISQYLGCSSIVSLENSRGIDSKFE